MKPRQRQKRLWIRLITFTVITAMLCQNIAWARGTEESKLAPCSLFKLIEENSSSKTQHVLNQKRYRAILKLDEFLGDSKTRNHVFNHRQLPWLPSGIDDAFLKLYRGGKANVKGNIAAIQVELIGKPATLYFFKEPLEKGDESIGINNPSDLQIANTRLYWFEFELLSAEKIVKRFRDKYSREILEKVRGYENYREFAKKERLDINTLQDVIYEKEMEFCKHVLGHIVEILEKANARLGRKKKKMFVTEISILFDLDETIGSDIGGWHIRPCIPFLFRFLKDNFNIRIGIASACERSAIDSYLQPGDEERGRLYEISQYIDTENIYSVRETGNCRFTDYLYGRFNKIFPGFKLFDPKPVLGALGWDDDKIEKFEEVIRQELSKELETDHATKIYLLSLPPPHERVLLEQQIEDRFSDKLVSEENRTKFLSQLQQSGIDQTDSRLFRKTISRYFEKRRNLRKQNVEAIVRFSKMIADIIGVSQEPIPMVIRAIYRLVAAKDVLEREKAEVSIVIDNEYNESEGLYELLTGKCRSPDAEDGYTLFGLENHRDRLSIISAGKRGAYDKEDILREISDSVKTVELVAEFDMQADANSETLNPIAEDIIRKFIKQLEECTDLWLDAHYIPIFVKGENGQTLLIGNKDGTPDDFGSYINLGVAIYNSVDAIADEAERQGTTYKGRITLRIRIETNRVIVELDDNGTGIPHNVLERLSNEYPFSTKSGDGFSGGKRTGGVGFGIFKHYGTELLHSCGGSLEFDTMHYDTGAYLLRRCYGSQRIQHTIQEGQRESQGTTVRWTLPEPEDRPRTPPSPPSPLSSPLGTHAVRGSGEDKGEGGEGKGEGRHSKLLDIIKSFGLPFLASAALALTILTPKMLLYPLGYNYIQVVFWRHIFTMAVLTLLYVLPKHIIKARSQLKARGGKITLGAVISATISSIKDEIIRDWKLIVLLGLLPRGLVSMLTFAALVYTSAFNVSLFLASTTIIVLAINVFIILARKSSFTGSLLNRITRYSPEMPKGYHFFSAFLASIGVFIALGGLSIGLTIGFAGIILLLLSDVLSGTISIYVNDYNEKLKEKKETYDSIALVNYSCFPGIVPFILLAGGESIFTGANFLSLIAPITHYLDLGLVALFAFLYLVFSYTALKYSKPANYYIIIASFPIFTILFAYLFYGGGIYLFQIAGAIFVIAAMALFNRKAKPSAESQAGREGAIQRPMKELLSEKESIISEIRYWEQEMKEKSRESAVRQRAHAAIEELIYRFYKVLSEQDFDRVREICTGLERGGILIGTEIWDAFREITPIEVLDEVTGIFPQMFMGQHIRETIENINRLIRFNPEDKVHFGLEELGDFAQIKETADEIWGSPRDRVILYLTAILHDYGMFLRNYGVHSHAVDGERLLRPLIDILVQKEIITTEEGQMILALIGEHVLSDMFFGSIPPEGIYHGISDPLMQARFLRCLRVMYFCDFLTTPYRNNRPLMSEVAKRTVQDTEPENIGKIDRLKRLSGGKEIESDEPWLQEFLNQAIFNMPSDRDIMFFSQLEPGILIKFLCCLEKLRQHFEVEPNFLFVIDSNSADKITELLKPLDPAKIDHSVIPAYLDSPSPLPLSPSGSGKGEGRGVGVRGRASSQIVVRVKDNPLELAKIKPNSLEAANYVIKKYFIKDEPFTQPLCTGAGFTLDEYLAMLDLEFPDLVLRESSGHAIAKDTARGVLRRLSEKGWLVIERYRGYYRYIIPSKPLEEEAKIEELEGWLKRIPKERKITFLFDLDDTLITDDGDDKEGTNYPRPVSYGIPEIFGLLKKYGHKVGILTKADILHTRLSMEVLGLDPESIDYLALMDSPEDDSAVEAVRERKVYVIKHQGDKVGAFRKIAESESSCGFVVCDDNRSNLQGFIDSNATRKPVLGIHCNFPYISLASNLTFAVKFLDDRTLSQVVGLPGFAASEVSPALYRELLPEAMRGHLHKRASIPAIRALFGPEYQIGGDKEEVYENNIAPVVEEYGLWLGLKLLKRSGGISAKAKDSVMGKVKELSPSEKFWFRTGFRTISIVSGIILFFTVQFIHPIVSGCIVLIWIIILISQASKFASYHEEKRSKIEAFIVASIINLGIFGSVFLGIIDNCSWLIFTIVIPCLIHSGWNRAIRFIRIKKQTPPARKGKISDRGISYVDVTVLLIGVALIISVLYDDTFMGFLINAPIFSVVFCLLLAMTATVISLMLWYTWLLRYIPGPRQHIKGKPDSDLTEVYCTSLEHNMDMEAEEQIDTQA